MWMSLCFVLMDRPEEAVESVNPREQGLPPSDNYILVFCIDVSS